MEKLRYCKKSNTLRTIPEKKKWMKTLFCTDERI